jgi:6-pyruvoyltetrahydropterin/6-carboxytetrahydropterin synthase
MSGKLFLTYQAHFDAAHFLHPYDGKCARMHGHRWEVILKLGPFRESELDAAGIVIDYHTIKAAMDCTLSQLDHNVVNDIIPTPSAEKIAFFLAGKFSDSFAHFYSVEVKESPEASAIVYSPDVLI